MRSSELSEDTGVSSVEFGYLSRKFSIGHTGVNSAYLVKPMRLSKESGFFLLKARSKHLSNRGLAGRHSFPEGPDFTILVAMGSFARLLGFLIRYVAVTWNP